MEKSFKIIADRYYKKALSLERENLPSTFEWYNSNPLNVRRGREISISAGLFLKGSVSSYWLNNPQELYFKNSEKSFLLEAATLFFSEYLKEDNPIEKTTSEPQRYGFLAVIYGEFHQICEKLEELNIHPQEGKSLYFASLHRLTEDILNYSPPQEKSPGTIENEAKARRRELAMAAQILDDFPILHGNVLKIPRDYWESLLKKFFEVNVLPDPKTISKYRKEIESTISYEYWMERKDQWNCLPSDDNRPPIPTRQKITIKFTK